MESLFGTLPIKPLRSSCTTFERTFHCKTSISATYIHVSDLETSQSSRITREPQPSSDSHSLSAIKSASRSGTPADFRHQNVERTMSWMLLCGGVYFATAKISFNFPKSKWVHSSHCILPRHLPQYLYN